MAALDGSSPRQRLPSAVRRRPRLLASTGAAAAAAVAVALGVAPTPGSAELPVVAYMLSNFQMMGLAQGSSSAIRALDDALYFWGDQIPVNSEQSTSQYTWLSLDSHTGYACGIERVTLQIMCWGVDKQVVSAAPVGQAALQVSTGSDHACALTFDTDLVDLQHLALKADTPENNAAFLDSLTPVCWGSGGRQSSENLVPPAIGNAADEDPVVSVRAGDGFTCVRTFKGRVQCSGAYGSLSGSAQSYVPEGVLFSALTVGEKHVAGVVLGTSEIRTWGDCSSLNECTAPTGVIWAGASGSLSAGRMFTCALDTQLQPHCWGRTFWPRDTPVESEFIEINSGMSHTCGIRRNDTRVACWGECSFGECDPPIELNRIPCERHAARGTCLRATSSGVCESRSCTAGYTWAFDAPCGCYYKLSSISVVNAGATVGGRSDGGTDCHKVAGVPFFYMDRADKTNLAPRCQS
ncbi:hypothetical protein MMPV_007073 [Pyropia vietnamensis]